MESVHAYYLWLVPCRNAQLEFTGETRFCLQFVGFAYYINEIFFLCTKDYFGISQHTMKYF